MRFDKNATKIEDSNTGYLLRGKCKLLGLHFFSVNYVKFLRTVTLFIFRWY